MSDVFDENEDMRSALKIAYRLKEIYDLELGGKMLNHELPGDFDSNRKRTQLAIQGPNVELLAQVVRDAASLMIQHNISPRQVK